MPDNTEAPAETTNVETPESSKPDLAIQVKDELAAKIKHLEAVEELLKQVNDSLGASTSIFPGSRLHEDIHLALTGQRL